MKVLITAGPTREPIDVVRDIGNRSSGQMGAALASAALRAGHAVTLDPWSRLGGHAHCRATDRRGNRGSDAGSGSGRISESRSADHGRRRRGLQAQGRASGQAGPSGHDSRSNARQQKTSSPLPVRSIALNQRTIGFSLESRGNLDRAREKLARKNLDLIVYNPTDTMNSATIEATLLWPDGRTEPLPSRAKSEFADILLDRAARLFDE